MLHKFDLEIRDQKGTENQVADHVSRLENHEHVEDGERLMRHFSMRNFFPSRMTPLWYANYVNFIVSEVLPLEVSFEVGSDSFMM